VDLEPVGSATVAGTTLGHAHQEALAQPARLAGRSVLLVDHTVSVVLASCYRRDVVVGTTEKGLRGKGNCILVYMTKLIGGCNWLRLVQASL